MKRNIILKSDSYKNVHWKMYPDNMTKMTAYFLSRGGKFDNITLVGLQYYLKEYLVGRVVTQEDVDYADEFLNKHFGQNLFNRAGWEHIVNNCGGKLPLRIEALPEGSVVPTKNVLFTITNTDDKSAWLVGWVETLLSKVWYPTTVASQNRAIKQTIKKYLIETSGDISGLDYKFHCFGYRGVSSEESAGIGGLAHITQFKGSDTLAGMMFAREYYNEDMGAVSIPALEHSLFFSGPENELATFERALEAFPTGLLACVSDTFNVFRACSEYWGGVLKDKVLQRDGLTIIRPDSGCAKDVVLELHNILGEKLGYTTNSLGYKVLSPKIAIIQGDGIDHQAIIDICENLKQNGWSTVGLAFGSGGANLQKVDRDTCKMAYKACHAVVDDKEVEIYKDPITDKGKQSFKGLVKVINNNGNIQTISINESGQNLLIPVYENGNLLIEYSLQEIRERAKI